jgi:hypothetical protein
MVRKTLEELCHDRGPATTFSISAAAAWYGYRWRITGGDFRVQTALLPFPFTNIFLPDLAAEGVKFEAASATRRYTIFYGLETLAGAELPLSAIGFEVAAQQSKARKKGAEIRSCAGDVDQRTGICTEIITLECNLALTAGLGISRIRGRCACDQQRDRPAPDC